ncbi:MAG: ATP-grasp domain-containing protein [Lachnospiraceae bacterium]|nr:ATP-grasp domain-containing protein [Lachnospiraceae bacterium]
MKNIVIIDAISTGHNFVEDIIRRGYNPIVFETNESDSEMASGLRSVYELMNHKPEIIHECDDYNDTLEIVRKYDPIAVLAGAETGVVLATRLSASLGLPGNSPDNLDKMIRKDSMQEALKQHGIRYIHGCNIHSVEEGLKFCKDNDLTCAVIKPIHSAGSQGVFLCDNLEEVENAITTLLSMNDMFDKKITEVVIQERIFGTEYIVNTMSRGGKHRLNTVLRYKKEKTPEGGYIYDYSEFIDKLEPGHMDLIEYAFSVADAIGYRYGSVHGEYMIDEKGPVLIEVNCRPMGGNMPGEFLDMITGQHETDSILDCYLDPEKFEIDSKKPYRLYRKGYLKIIIVPKELEVYDHPICEVAKQLRSTFLISAGDISNIKYYPKTRDLETNGGMIYLINDDNEVLRSDIELLENAEKKFFQILLSDGTSRRLVADTSKAATPDALSIIRQYDCHGATLIISEDDTPVEGCQVVTPATLSDAYKGFDNVITLFGKSLTDMTETQCLRLMFEIMDKAKCGGRIIIPKCTYEYLSYGRNGAEELMTIKGLMLEAPLPYKENCVVGTSVRV